MIRLYFSLTADYDLPDTIWWKVSSWLLNASDYFQICSFDDSLLWLITFILGEKLFASPECRWVFPGLYQPVAGGVSIVSGQRNLFHVQNMSIESETGEMHSSQCTHCSVFPFMGCTLYGPLHMVHCVRCTGYGSLQMVRKGKRIVLN